MGVSVIEGAQVHWSLGHPPTPDEVIEHGLAASLENLEHWIIIWLTLKNSMNLKNSRMIVDLYSIPKAHR